MTPEQQATEDSETKVVRRPPTNIRVEVDKLAVSFDPVPGATGFNLPGFPKGKDRSCWIGGQTFPLNEIEEQTPRIVIPLHKLPRNHSSPLTEGYYTIQVQTAFGSNFSPLSDKVEFHLSAEQAAWLEDWRNGKNEKPIPEVKEPTQPENKIRVAQQVAAYLTKNAETIKALNDRINDVDRKIRSGEDVADQAAEMRALIQDYKQALDEKSALLEELRPHLKDLQAMSDASKEASKTSKEAMEKLNSVDLAVKTMGERITHLNDVFEHQLIHESLEKFNGIADEILRQCKENSARTQSDPKPEPEPADKDDSGNSRDSTSLGVPAGPALATAAVIILFWLFMFWFAKNDGLPKSASAKTNTEASMDQKSGAVQKPMEEKKDLQFGESRLAQALAEETAILEKLVALRTNPEPQLGLVINRSGIHIGHGGKSLSISSL